MNTVTRYQGNVLAVTTNGRIEYLSARNGDECKFLFVESYLKTHQIAPDVLALYEQDREWVKAKEESGKSHEKACIDQAAISGKPVVISSAEYHTTAGVGRNYAVAMPDGRIVTARSGNSKASRHDKCGYSFDWRLSQQEKESIISVIRK